MNGLTPCIKLLLWIIIVNGTASYSQQARSDIFVHTDKYIYNTGETIWFKAYFNPYIPLHETLHIKLVNLSSNSVVIEKEFPAYDIRAHGQIVLPDSIAEGAYNFIAFGNKTNILNQNTVYIQKITILKRVPNALKVRAHVLPGSKIAPGNIVEIKFNVQERENLAQGAKGRCIIAIEDRNKVFYTLKLKTDTNGNATAVFKYPEITPYEHLYVCGEFNYSNKTAKAEIYLPSEKEKITTTFAIEGGQLIANTKNKIIVSLKDSNGYGITDSVILIEKDITLKSVKTDSTGIAFLEFTPQINHEYRIETPANKETVILPASKTGTNLKFIDNRKLKIVNTGVVTTRNLTLHSERGSLFFKEIRIKKQDSISVRLPNSNVNNIISSLLTDKDSTLTNERLFTQGYLPVYRVTVTTTNKKAKPHEKIHTNVSVKDAQGNPIKANLSIAIVHNKAIDKSAYKTIQNYINKYPATHRELQHILLQPLSMTNNLLIGEKWLSDTCTKNINIRNLPVDVNGKIVDKRNKPAFIDRLILGTAEGIKNIKVEKDGKFTIPAEYLIASEGQQNYIFTTGLKAKNYHIVFDSLPNNTLDIVALSSSNTHHEYANFSQIDIPLIIPGFENIEEVVIEKQSSFISDVQYQSWVRDYPENCRDFVCEQNVLNCSSHKIGLPPHLGEKYVYGYDRNYVYKKCIDCDCKIESNTLPLKTITRPESFPVITFEGNHDLQYYTTLYWEPNLHTDANGNGAFDFMSSDLCGNYKIIIQGINTENNEVIYSEEKFEVVSGN